MADSTARAEALAQLAALGVTNDLTETVVEPKLELTGDEVYAGGDVARILIRPAHLTYREGTPPELLYAEAKVGDTVLLDKAQAKRLDELGATTTKAKASKAPAPVEVPSVPEHQLGEDVTDGTPDTPAAPSSVTDEELGAMKAGELIAHVNQHNGDKARVYALELARPEPRSTVLKASSPHDPDEELD